MIFVPDVAPHFVLVCLENFGWSVRDYSSGQVRLLPAVWLGKPVEQIVTKPKPEGCLAFAAPRVATANQSFWKRLTDELGQRFLGAPAAASVAEHLYPVLAAPEFSVATAHLTEFERENILRSPRSADWTTWNAMQLLMTTHPDSWWSAIVQAAALANPANQFDGLPKAEFWKLAGPSSRVDLCFDGGDWLVFVESSRRTAHDPRRNRVVQLADRLLTAASGRPCALWILARDLSPDRELVERYRSSPEMFAAELPSHPAETLYQLARRLTVLRWSDILGPLVERRASDDPVTARVRKELRRRIRGVAVAAAG